MPSSVLSPRSIRLVTALAALAAGRAASADLVVNGGFETGDFSGWTVEHAAVGSDLALFTNDTPFGTFYASFSADGGLYDGISQALATSAGNDYQVSMWVYNLGIENDSLLVDWEGQTVQAFTPVGTGLESWTEITFVVHADQNGSLFRIRGFDGQAAFGLDAISVVAVPAPGAGALLLLAVGAGRRRRA